MEENSFNDIKLYDEDKKIFEEIDRLMEANNIGEALKCINHAINGYLNKALLGIRNLQSGIPDSPEKQKHAFIKMIQSSLKASLVAKRLRKFYHL